MVSALTPSLRPLVSQQNETGQVACDGLCIHHVDFEFRKILRGHFCRAHRPADLGRRGHNNHIFPIFKCLLENRVVKRRRRRGGLGQLRRGFELLQESGRIQFGIIAVGIFPKANNLWDERDAKCFQHFTRQSGSGIGYDFDHDFLLYHEIHELDKRPLAKY